MDVVVAVILWRLVLAKLAHGSLIKMHLSQVFNFLSHTINHGWMEQNDLKPFYI